MSNAVDTIIVFRILKKLTTPFEKTEAFKAGVIDKKGKVLVKPRDRTREQKKSMSMLDRLVFNLKRVIAKAPGGGSTVGSYIAALALIKEHVEELSNTDTSKALMEKMEEHNLIPAGIEYDLSTAEGFMDAWEDAMVEGMSSGAAFGGRMSGAGDNATINATGMAGIDRPLGNKKKKKNIEKVIQKRL